MIIHPIDFELVILLVLDFLQNHSRSWPGKYSEAVKVKWSQAISCTQHFYYREICISCWMNLNCYECCHESLHDIKKGSKYRKKTLQSNLKQSYGSNKTIILFFENFFACNCNNNLSPKMHGNGKKTQQNILINGCCNKIHCDSCPSIVIRLYLIPFHEDDFSFCWLIQ